MTAQHGEEYGPIFGVKQYPPEERGPWKRWKRAIAKRRWRREHDAGFRERERERVKVLKERSKKPCPGCGKAIHSFSKTCMRCRNVFGRCGIFTPARLLRELSTPYRNGMDKSHERNIQRLEAELKEARV